LLRRVELPASVLRRGMHLRPPFLGADTRVTRVSDDYFEVDKTRYIWRTQARAVAPIAGDAERRPRAKA
jgi:hypothetical protein